MASAARATRCGVHVRRIHGHTQTVNSITWDFGVSASWVSIAVPHPGKCVAPTTWAIETRFPAPRNLQILNAADFGRVPNDRQVIY